jgi:hypothetical protein
LRFFKKFLLTNKTETKNTLEQTAKAKEPEVSVPTPAMIAAADRKRDQTLVLVLECAVNALHAIDDDTLTRRMMIGTVHDIVRTFANEYAEVNDRIDNIPGIAQLQLQECLQCRE